MEKQIKNYSTFDKDYHKNAINQKLGFQELSVHLDFANCESILDLGCGSGEHANFISKNTEANVIGIDISAKQIEEAKKQFSKQDNLKFYCIDAHDIDFSAEFDLIYSNSVIHWFKKPLIALRKAYKALTPGGVFAVQTPLKLWCPIMIEAISFATRSEKIHNVFSSYRNPWFHLSHVDEYRKLFEDIGFIHVASKEISTVNKSCSLENIINLFKSGPAQAYLNQENYNAPIPEWFSDEFLYQMGNFITNKLKNNVLDLSYNRAIIILKK